MVAVAAAACPPANLGNSRTALVLLSHEFREIHRSASLRQDGSSSRGRKTKHNTATRRWIDTVGLPDLAAGKLPSAQDLAMLRSGPRGSLSGAALAARDAWSQQHARDPRSKQLTAAEKTGQQTLLAWARTNTPDALSRSTAQRGRPENYKLHFGGPAKWEGWTLRQMLTLATKTKTVQERAMATIKATVPPGNHLAWFTNQTPSTKPFVFDFRNHFYVYLALKEMADEVSLP